MEQDERIHVGSAYGDGPGRSGDYRPGDRFAGAPVLLFEQAMSQTRMAVCLSDPRREDCPIVFANRAFLELTGYQEFEVLGRNCRFLQGPETDPAAVARMRQALTDEAVIVAELRNYRKDGTVFWNALNLGPIYDGNGELIYYFGSQWDVSDVHAARADEAHARAMFRELSHRMKNVFSVIAAVISISGRAHNVPEFARTVRDRVIALGRAYEPTLGDTGHGSVEIGDTVRSVLAPYGRGTDRIRFLGGSYRTNAIVVSVVGLALHELAMNAIKGGALSNDTGTVSVDWRLEGDKESAHFVIEWVENGGPEVTAGTLGGGRGRTLIQTMVQAAQGAIYFDWQSAGAHIKITIPNTVARMG